MKGILCIDIGTSSIRGITYDIEGNSLHTYQQTYSPTFLADGYVEQDPMDWINYTNDILDNTSHFIKRQGLDLVGISITAQRSSVIPVDKKGHALYKAIMWQDRRTVPICEALATQTQTVYKTCGLKISPIFSAVKMTWLKKHKPEIYKGTYKMMGIQDFVLHYLTGLFVTDKSLASRTNLFNLKTLNWDDDLIKIFDISKDKLCDLVDPGSIVGDIRKELSQRFNLPQNLAIISSGGDQQNAALGLGVMSSGDYEVNTGTGGYIISHSSCPVFDKDLRVFCNVSAIKDQYILEAGIPTSGVIYDWFNKNFYKPLQANEPIIGNNSHRDQGKIPKTKVPNNFEAINKDVMSTPPGSNGLILMPHFKGSGAPSYNPLAKGIFYNLSLETSRGEMARSILEGITSEIAANITLIESLSIKANMIKAAGGLTKFPTYNQIQADMYQRKLEVMEKGEATSLGAWINGMVALGLAKTHKDAYKLATTQLKMTTYTPNPKVYPVYQKLIKKKSIIYDALNTSGIY